MKKTMKIEIKTLIINAIEKGIDEGFEKAISDQMYSHFDYPKPPSDTEDFKRIVLESIKDELDIILE